METTITKKIGNPDIQEQIWQIYKSSFTGTEKICAQNQQCYTRESFFAALLDEEYLKVFLLHNGQVIGYTLLTNNLKKASITYMNPEKYQCVFPEYAKNQKIYYFTSVAILPDYRVTKCLFELLAPVVEYIDRLDGVYAFDFSYETVKGLSQIFERIGKVLYKQGRLKREYTYRTVGIQEFGAIAPKDQNQP